MANLKDIGVEKRFEKPDAYYGHDRSELLTLMPNSVRRVIDVGCGSGQSWRSTELEVWGIERSPKAADEARRHLKEVYCGDVETLPMSFQPESFDAVVLGDILEHLYDPWGLLLRVREFLKRDGYLILSIPNVRYYRVLKRIILRGEFRYADEGILDIDHIRFFALEDIRWMLDATGFEILELRRKTSASRFVHALNGLCFGALKEFMTEQYFILARKR